LQQVLVAAMEAFPNFRGEASVRTWIASIAVRVVQAHWRRPSRQQVSLELVPEPVTEEGAGQRQAEHREGIRRLYLQLANLSPKKRLAFSLHVLEGRPIAEVATMMQAGQSATKSRVFFARRELLRSAGQDPLLKTLVEESAARGLASKADSSRDSEQATGSKQGGSR